jgi:hypothetical protein
MTLLEQQIIDEAEAEGTQPSDDFDIANLAARFCEIAADRLLAILAKTQA